MTLMSGEGQGKSSSVKRVLTIAATLVFFLVILFFRQAGKQLSLCPDPFEVKFIQFSIERVWLTKSLTSRQHTLERSFQVQRDAEGKNWKNCH